MMVTFLRIYLNILFYLSSKIEALVFFLIYYRIYVILLIGTAIALRRLLKSNLRLHIKKYSFVYLMIMWYIALISLLYLRCFPPTVVL